MTFGSGTPQRAARHRRWWLFAPVFFVLLAMMVVGAAWHWRTSLAENLLPRVTQSMDIDLVAVSVERLGLDGAKLADLQFGPLGAQKISLLELQWSIPELLNRRVRAIEVSGADLQVTIDEDGGPVLEGMSLPGGVSGTSGELIFPNALPAERIDVRQGGITVTLPDGQANIVVDGQLEVLPGEIMGEIAARYTAETGRGRGSGAGRASFSWAENSAPSSNFTLLFDRLITAGVIGTNISVSGSTNGLPTRFEDLSFRASALADLIETPQLTVRDVDLAAELSGGELNVGGSGGILDWVVEMSAHLQPFDLSTPAEIKLNASGDAATVSQRAAFVSASGEAVIEVDALVRDPAELIASRAAIIGHPAVMVDHITGRLDLETQLEQFVLSDTLRTGAVSAKVSARWDGDALDVDIEDRLSVDNVTLASPLESKTAALLPGGSPFNIAVTEGMGTPATVRIDLADGSFDVRAVGGVELGLPEGTVELEVDGSAMMSKEGAIEALDVAALSAVLRDVPTKIGSATGDVLITDLSVVGESISGIVGGKVSVSDIFARGISAHQVSLDIDGEFRATPDEVSAALSPGGQVTTREVRLRDGMSLPGTTRLQLAGGTHQVALNRGVGAVSLDVRLKPGKVKARSGPRTVGFTHAAAVVSGTWPGRLSIGAEDVSMDLDADRSANLTDLRVRAEGNISNAAVAVSASAAELELPGLTLPPFDVSAKITRRGPSFSGALEIIATGGQPSLQARGQHNLKTGQGRAEITEARLRFAPGVLQPGDINPVLAGTVENVFATLLLQGPVAWERGSALTPNLTLTIDELAAASDSLELSEGEATIVLTGVPDLETPPGQRFAGKVRVGRLEPVPLDVSFQLLPGQSASGPKLVIEALEVQLAEGHLATDRFILTPPSTDTDLTLQIQGADLARAFKVIGIAGIGGTGKISGEIPVSVRGNQLAISGGRLANDRPGEVFYDLAALPQPLIDRDDTVTLVLEALSNFAYDELQAEMDKALDGPGSLRMRLTGANPDVLENHPFVFNINLESNFDRLAALVLEGLTTSQGLLRALALSAGDSGGAVALP